MTTQTEACCSAGPGAAECGGETTQSEERQHETGAPNLVNSKVRLLIAAGAAMAANCEACLNKIVPDLKAAGVSDIDIRNAVQIGQYVKDRPAANMKALADTLTGSHLVQSD